MNRFSFIILFVFACWSGQCSAQFDVFTNVTGNAVADQAFEAAANIWATEFEDEMSLFLDYSFATLDSDVLSTAISGTSSVSYTDFWTAIGNDVTSSDDTTMFGALPTGTSFSTYINQTSEASGTNFEIPYVDNDAGLNNVSVQLTSANAKALGLKNPHITTVDGVVVFNDAFQWDFDPSDGIDAGHIDFIGTALHEIGHTLGFVSGVDQLDANGAGQFSDNDLPFVSSLDFLRFSDDSELAGADIDWTADNRAKYFSIDGGLTPAAPGSSHWSTGEMFGDGEQASHWKDGVNLGVMDPTIASGLVNSISGVDLLALDVIGYNRAGILSVPEPGSLLVLVALGGLVCSRRRKRD